MELSAQAARDKGVFIYQTESHYDDMDGQMIMHHPKYLLFVERAQQFWLETVLEAPRFAWEAYPDMYLVVRKLEMEYLSPIDFIGPFQIWLWCRRIRAAGMTTAFQFRSTDGKLIYAQGYRENCRIAREDHRALMWTPLFYERFSQLEQAAKAFPALEKTLRG